MNAEQLQRTLNELQSKFNVYKRQPQIMITAQDKDLATMRDMMAKEHQSIAKINTNYTKVAQLAVDTLNRVASLSDSEIKLKQENATLRAQLNQVRTNYQYLWQEYQFRQTDRATSRRSRRNHIASPYNRHSPPYSPRSPSYSLPSPIYSPRWHSSSPSRSHSPLSPTYSPIRHGSSPSPGPN